MWLAPVQAVVLPITDRQLDYARQVRDRLEAAGFRATIDDRKEKVNLKIRDAQLQKVPYMLVVGDREAQAGQVAVRNRKHADLGAKAAGSVYRGPAETNRYKSRRGVSALVVSAPEIGGRASLPAAGLPAGWTRWNAGPQAVKPAPYSACRLH